jgi:hypothetical protein
MEDHSTALASGDPTAYPQLRARHNPADGGTAQPNQCHAVTAVEKLGLDRASVGYGGDVLHRTKPPVQLDYVASSAGSRRRDATLLTSALQL